MRFLIPSTSVVVVAAVLVVVVVAATVVTISFISSSPFEMEYNPNAILNITQKKNHTKK